MSLTHSVAVGRGIIVSACPWAGINVRRCKLLAFVISAIYAGFAGGLIAHMPPGFINPNNFTLLEMVTLLLMVVVGGIGNIWGGIIGARAARRRRRDRGDDMRTEGTD